MGWRIDTSKILLMKYILRSATPFMLKLVSSNDTPKRLTHNKLIKELMERMKITAKNNALDK